MNTYFDWGIGPGHEPQIGIWSPVLDRFLLVLCDREFSTTIKYLCSSRYSLYLFDLSTSANYTPTLIDNSCCQNWTISNRKDIKLSRPHDYDLVRADLIPAPNECDWDVESEQQWLQFIWHNLKFIQNLKNQHTWYKYSKFLNSIGMAGKELNETASLYNEITSIENYILKSLYLGDNIKDTKQAIDLHISQGHPHIKLSANG